MDIEKRFIKAIDSSAYAFTPVQGIDNAASACMKIHREESIRFSEWVENNAFKDCADLYAHNGKLVNLSELFDLFISENKGK